MTKIMPQVTKELGFDFWWDTQKLWDSNFPIEEVDIRELIWMYDFPLWDYEGKPVNLKPIDVKLHPRKYKEQYKKTMQADLSYPISIIFLNGRWVIMDGLHRLLKADLLGYKIIKAKKFHKEHIPQIEQK